jgi:hypothetical protein
MSEDLPDINQGILKPELFEKFKLQLQKDFENCGVDGTFCNCLKADYDLIFQELYNSVKQINKNVNSKLNELLYRIDISEVQIKKLSKQKPEAELEEVISELIIKRELQKIVYKEFFKKHE